MKKLTILLSLVSILNIDIALTNNEQHDVGYEVLEHRAILTSSPYRRTGPFASLFECLAICTRHGRCFMVQYGLAMENNLHTCHLYDLQAYGESKDQQNLEFTREYHLLRVAELCQKRPCKNDAECRSTFDDYTCVCSKENIGKNCQEVILQHLKLDGTDHGISLVNKPVFVTGRLPGTKAISFTNLKSYVKVPKIVLNKKSFTFACWIKVRQHSPTQALYNDWHSPWQFIFMIYNKKLALQRHSTNGDWYHAESKENVIPIGSWCHVALTWDRDKAAVKLFVDAELVGAHSLDRSKEWSGPVLDYYQIGDDGHSSNHQFYGSMMDFYVIEGALTRKDIKAMAK